MAAVPPTLSAVDADVPMSVAPAPLASVAFCQRFVKPVRVEPVPPFVIVAEKELLFPAMPTGMAGVGALAVSSGAITGRELLQANVLVNPAEETAIDADLFGGLCVA
ncbi:MAG: hypothetical protein UY94_C0041G0005 [Parcubacteria group bacterium GW2011_GWA2_56_21]|nr:MAG: hypothetical protein UY94_C0041G0005 [Parcubacteria group bacterium GW2011_GWA2_56_21]